MTIKDIETKELVTIIAGLVREGLTFDCWSSGDGLWTIKLIGGY